MPALTAPTTARRTIDRIRWSQLDQWQRMAVAHTLGRLGCDEGVIEDEPAVTDPGQRSYESADLAADLHLDLAPGEEIGQCNWDLAVTGLRSLEEYEGRLYCAVDCLELAREEDNALPQRLAA